MIKSFLLSFIAAAFFICLGSTAQSQNLVVNGDLESWTAGAPDGWGIIENITQETTTVHGGTSSARHTSTTSTKKFQQELSGIVAGQEYTISYWYYDNDPAARTRIWSFWLSGSTTLPDNLEELRPTVYSTDNPSWQNFSVVLTAPAAADGFRFEVRGYQENSTSGGSIFYDDFTFSGDITIIPEPTNYPTAFTATAAGLGINLTWTDAVGAQLPSGYIIMAGINAALPVPADGTPVPNDIDLSDGSGALNVAYGMEEAAFGGLESSTNYYFTIYPYTNGGANIDYKNSGTAPAANTTTSNIAMIESENFDASWGNWTPISVIGDQVWDRNNTYGVGNTACARVSGFSGAAFDNEDWLISPAMNFNNYSNETLEFFNAKNYTGPDLECKISTDYDGGGDPNSANWTTLTYTMSAGGWAWTSSGIIDLSSYNGTVYVAFYFISNTTESATWEIDNIVITGEGGTTIYPEPTNYPTSFSADATGTSILLSWADAIGTQLPSKYLIFGGTSASLPVPVDGTPVPNDLNLVDGSGAINVAFGIEEATFTGLTPGVTYHFVIYPYTNSGVNIDYKTSGTAPTANATTVLTPEPTNYPTAFNASPTSNSVGLTWTDAVGSQLPEKYIIFGGTSASLPVPVDGTPIPDDTNLNDGSGVLNIAYGVQQASFSGLTPNTTYHFSIYSYTNSGALINYKTDGIAPTAEATITPSVLLTIEAENFDVSWGNWTPVSVIGDQVWNRENTFGVGNTPCASMSGYSGAPFENEDWLISPSLDLDNYINEYISFQNAKNYTGNDLELKVSTDYSGSGDPNSGTWTTLTFTMSPGSWAWTPSGEVDLSGYNGSAVYVAFKFTSTSAASATWEVDEIEIKGEEDLSSDNEVRLYDLINIYPNPSNGMISIMKPGSGFEKASIISATGSLVEEFELSDGVNHRNLSEMNKGVYFILITDEQTGQTVAKKLILN